jgi:hypothetical protein
MNLALDLGSTEFRSLRATENSLLARRVPAHYTVLAESPRQRQLLQHEQIPFLAAPGQLIVFGQWAAEVCEMQNSPLIPVISESIVPLEDPVGRQVCAALLSSVLPPAARGESSPVCFGVLPGDASSGSATFEFFRRILLLQGYQLIGVRQALALTISQLSKFGYSGLSFSFGADSVSVCISQRGIPLWQQTQSIGTRKLEREFAVANQKMLWDRQGNRYLDLHGIEHWLKSGRVQLHQGPSPEERLLATLVRQLFRTILPAVAEALGQQEIRKHVQPGWPILVGGGITRIAGFAQLFYESLLEARLPLERAEIRLAGHDPHAAARGALILSMLEAENPLREILHERAAA